MGILPPLPLLQFRPNLLLSQDRSRPSHRQASEPPCGLPCPSIGLSPARPPSSWPPTAASTFLALLQAAAWTAWSPRRTSKASRDRRLERPSHLLPSSTWLPCLLALLGFRPEATAMRIWPTWGKLLPKGCRLQSRLNLILISLLHFY